MLVVIGQRWFEPVEGAKEPRLHDPRDWVRREIELGLRGGTRVIPVLVDGATIPDKDRLPLSLAALPTLNAINIPWHESVNKLSKIISEVTDAGSRYDLTRHLDARHRTAFGRNPVIAGMEISLAHQGEMVTLDDEDLAKKFEEVTKRPITRGTVIDEIMYVIDRVGIDGTTVRGDRRTYTARAYKLKSIRQIPGELEKGRPIFAGAMVYEKWFSPPTNTNGLVEDWEEPGPIRGATLVAIVGFDPGEGSIRILTVLPNWGQDGLGRLTAAAARRFLPEPDTMYSIEAAEIVSLTSKFQ